MRLAAANDTIEIHYLSDVAKLFLTSKFKNMATRWADINLELRKWCLNYSSRTHVNTGWKVDHFSTGVDKRQIEA